MKMKNNQEFIPFYERYLGQFMCKVFASMCIGLIFLGTHYLARRSVLFEDWSWFLCVLICTAMLCLYYATHTLRTLFPEMESRLGNDSNKIYKTKLKSILSDRNFILAGLIFANLNCTFGFIFGLPYTDAFAADTILIGYIIAGFICGMAVLGIIGVSVSISAFSRDAKRTFDFTSPDGCGGTLFLGEALIIFSSVTLIVGVMISVYITKTNWHYESVWYINPLKYFWMLFPYMMSLIALIGPAIQINSDLRKYKLEQEVMLQSRLTEIRKRLENKSLDADERNNMREDYEMQLSARSDLHGMRTWPFGVSANLKYLAVFVANLFASFTSLTNVFKSW